MADVSTRVTLMSLWKSLRAFLRHTVSSWQWQMCLIKEWQAYICLLCQERVQRPPKCPWTHTLTRVLDWSPLEQHDTWHSACNTGTLEYVMCLPKQMRQVDCYKQLLELWNTRLFLLSVLKEIVHPKIKNNLKLYLTLRHLWFRLVFFLQLNRFGETLLHM